MGDPSRKRGLELGYDVGLKAARQESVEAKASVSNDHPEYQNADKWYRYEYGSRAQFVAGFRSGFSAAYRQALKKSPAAKLEKTSEQTANAPLAAAPKLEKAPEEMGNVPPDAAPAATVGFSDPEVSKPAALQPEADAL